MEHSGKKYVVVQRYNKLDELCETRSGVADDITSQCIYLCLYATLLGLDMHGDQGSIVFA